MIASILRFQVIRRRLFVILLLTVPLLLSALPGGGFCQESYFETDPAWSSGPTSYTRSVVLGDIDCDGDLDLIFGNYIGINELYLNEDGVFQSSPIFFGSSSYDAALGDIDGDGDLDLVCGNWGKSNTLYLNEGGVFQSSPAWSSGPTNSTFSVALGDIDGDGDLDLVCGNESESNTLYLNDAGVFQPDPAWSSGPTNGTYSVTLGDVDDDGDLDLVCGNWGESNALYLNEGGVFQSSPVWSSGPTNRTNSLALGDIDGDGDLDLVCGNDGVNTLYLNEGGVFQSSPAWSSEPASITWSVALGDIDGDDDLDLICGNWHDSNTLYLNDAGVFQSSPVWSSAPTHHTWSVALGDIDMDGDLDLVCGNYEMVNTLYLNNGNPFQFSPAWSSAPTNETNSVDLGDIDGDGDLDLVCGNDGVNTLYLNEGGVFLSSPAWSSAPTNYTNSVALGDIDGDGDLDLVCGNGSIFSYQRNTLYLNEGGTFAATPAWSSAPTNNTTSVALGDIDGDGDLDLACGNGYNDGYNTIYLNDGGMFQSSPAWSAMQYTFTQSVALGDVDGDKDLDLVFGNSAWGNCLYLNYGVLFQTSPDWWSSPGNPTTSVVLGDIDGDGDIDLVFGNRFASNTLYLNDGNAFQVYPAWSSGPTNDTRSIALGDVEGDGDLDLICGNSNNKTLYLNEDGVFQFSPAGSWGLGQNNITLGDIDNDGDLDLVCGSGASNTLYLGKSAPAFKGDPLNPINHLPNNGANLRYVSAEKLNPEYYRVHFTAIDVESDSIWIIPEYQYKGAPIWYPAIVDGQPGKIGPFAASPSGIRDSIDWDTSTLLFDTRDVVLRLRIISIPKRVSVIRHSTSYLKEIGPIEPYRPEISTSINALSFSTVTVGDTVFAYFDIGNSGNLILSVNDIIVPSSEMRLWNTVPFDLVPSGQMCLVVSCEPRTEIAITGTVQIISTDPLRPSVEIPVSTDIRALEFETELLTQAEEIPLGEAVTADITPAPDVNVEQGYLYYRPGGAAQAFADSVPLSRTKSGFISIIPGEAVTEAGLEYFVKVENSGIFATDPPGAPASFFTQAVEAPAAISSFPKPNSGSGFLENRLISVEVLLPDGAVFDSGILHYRAGGKKDYQTLSIEYEDPLPVATIPDSVVGPKGLEYWVEINTLTNTLTDPPITPALNPRTIQITVQNLEEENPAPASLYRMISIPLLFAEDFSGTIEALLAEQPEFGPYDPVNWRTYCYVPDLLRYVELSEVGAAEHFRPEPGNAFWLISKETSRITTAPITGYSTPTDSSCEVVLSPGWNMIGNPFDFHVAWDSILVGELTMAEADTIVEPPISWIIGHGYQYGVGIIEPFVGYWVNNLSESSVILKVPPREAPSETPLSEPEVLAYLSNADETGNSWSIVIKASSNEAADDFNIIGVRRDASNSWDNNDRSEPPMSPGRAISLYFPHTAWERHPGNYTIDIRGVYEALNAGQLALCDSEEELWGHLWRFDVSKSFSDEAGGDEVTLEFDGIESLPVAADVYIVDRHMLKLVDLRTERIYRFNLGHRGFAPDEEHTRFVLLVGSDEFMSKNEDELPKPPTETVLHQNYPNPFNPSTVIHYDIAAPGTVELKIYDARGQIVKTLLRDHRDPGRYEIGWNGTNNAGLRVASGIYFYRLVAGDFVQTKKMVLLR